MTDERRLAAAAALRALNNDFVAHDAAPDLLDRIAASARQASVELRSSERRDLAPVVVSHAGRMFRVEAMEQPMSIEEDDAPPGRVGFMSDRAVGGRTNPLAADLHFEYGDDEVVVRTVLGAAYEGAPGRAHGGMVAALFDDITGFLLPLAGTAAFTGEITVRYHRPVPIEVPLEFCSRIEGRQGRKIHVTAECRAGGEEIVASAEVVFITVDISRFGRSAGEATSAPTDP